MVGHFVTTHKPTMPTASNRRTRRRSRGSEEEKEEDGDSSRSPIVVHKDFEGLAGLLDIQQTLKLWDECARSAPVEGYSQNSKDTPPLVSTATDSATKEASKIGYRNSKDTSLLLEVKEMVKRAGLDLDLGNDDDDYYTVQQSAKKKRKVTTDENGETSNRHGVSGCGTHRPTNIHTPMRPNRFQDFVGTTGLLCSVASFMDEVTLYCWEQAYPQLVDNPTVSGKRWAELAKDDEPPPHGLIDDEDWTIFRELAGSRQDEENANIVRYHDVKLAPQKEQRWVPFLDNPVTDIERGRQLAQAFLFTAARAKEADQIIFDFDKYAQGEIPYRYPQDDSRVIALKETMYWKQFQPPTNNNDDYDEAFVMISIRDDDTPGATLVPRRSWGGYQRFCEVLPFYYSIKLSGEVFDSLDFSEFRDMMALQLRNHDQLMAHLGRKIQVTITFPSDERIFVATGGCDVDRFRELSNLRRSAQNIISLHLHERDDKNVWWDGDERALTRMQTEIQMHTVRRTDTTEGPDPVLAVEAVRLNFFLPGYE